MIPIIILNLICLLFAKLYSKGRLPSGLRIVFVLQFLFFSIRVDYGNDYDHYLEIFNMFSSKSLIDALSTDYNHFELGWRLLCVCLGGFGFQSLIITVQALYSISFYKFIKDCIPQRYTLFAIFIYIFNPDYMLIPLSMLREGVAICFSMICLTYILREKYTKSLIFAIIAFLFHRTAVVLCLVYLFLLVEPYIRKNANKIIAICFALLFPLAAIIVNKYSAILLGLDSLARYENSLDRTDGLSFGIVNIFEFVLYGLPAFVYYKYCRTNTERTICQVYLLSYIIYPFATLTVLLQRLSIYLNIVSISAIPLLATKMSPSIKTPYVGIYVIYTIYRFIGFFYSPIYGKFYIEYHTIFG